LRLINIYAPSGAEKRHDRETFFNSEVPKLLLGTPSKTILGCDFNCVLNKADCTGNFNYSRALHIMVRGLDLTDMWEQPVERKIYTHYTGRGASRLDRFYASRTMYTDKSGIETALAAFTDHLAVIMRIKVMEPTIQRGRGYWKMNSTFVHNIQLQSELQQQWIRWKLKRKFYLDSVQWWERVVKKQIRLRHGTEARREARHMENFYHACIYDLLQSPEQQSNCAAKINHLKAKLILLFNKTKEKGMIEASAQERYPDEQMSLYHIIKQRKRRTLGR
jgi:hypothetical protein